MKERWQQISSIFQGALQQETAARDAFVRRACGNDEDLAREVESLLSAFGNAGEAFEEPALEVAARMMVDGESALGLDRQIGAYRIIRHLGAGGMGEVYLAEDTTLCRNVALKFLPAHLSAHEEQMRRFQQEARAASALNHPNILTVHEMREHEGRHFIVMEYVEGETLRQKMKLSQLTLAEKLDLAIQVAEALNAAHTAGIIHRDIKPENIMIRPDGYVKVLDFGLAKLTLERVDTDLEATTKELVETLSGVVMGTVRYMSPEQARGLKLDQRTDVWSLGVILYEMLAGRAPFNRATNADTIVAILEHEPAPLPDEIPAILDQCARKALCKDCGERYQSAQEFAAELKQIKYALELSSASFEKLNGLAVSTSENPPVNFDRDFKTISAKTVHETGAFSIVDQFLRSRLQLALILSVCLALLVSAFVFLRPALFKPQQANETKVANPVSGPQKMYREMAEDERLAFVKTETMRLSQIMGGPHESLSVEAVKAIKQIVDVYDKRRENASQEPFHESLQTVYTRASLYAPLFSYNFNKQRVPPLIGLYIPMIESEYHDCLTSPLGAKGKFQFLEQTARAYGIKPEDRCNVDRIAPAAARFIADRIAEFGADSASMTLVIASFNRGQEGIRKDLMTLSQNSNQKINRSFWSLFANADKLDEQFRNETIHYVPKFFAAAIVGENPQAFSLTTPPLSSLSVVK
jgi:serine/threonine protein kinase